MTDLEREVARRASELRFMTEISDIFNGSDKTYLS